MKREDVHFLIKKNLSWKLHKKKKDGRPKKSYFLDWIKPQTGFDFLVVALLGRIKHQLHDHGVIFSILGEETQPTVVTGTPSVATYEPFRLFKEDS